MTGLNFALLARNTNVKLRDGLTPEALADFPHFVTMRDTLLSGWGEAEGGNSFYVLACRTMDEVRTVAANAEHRDEMTNVRVITKLTATAIGAKAGDHVSITSADETPRWYKVGAFGGEA